MPVGDDDTIASPAASASSDVTPAPAGERTGADPAQMIAGRYRVVRWLGGGGMGRVYEVVDTELEKKLAANAKAQADKEVYLHADRDVPYGTVVEVMAAAQRAGITNVGMITDPVGTGAASKGKKEAKR